MSPSSATLQQGQTLQLSARSKPAETATFVWGSSNSAAASVSGTGLVTGLTSGTATVTATAGGRTGSGHEHIYERFAPQTPTGGADPSRGIRQFTVGTGGRELYGLGTTQPNSQVRYNLTAGILKFTLYSGGYSWQYIPTSGSFTDSGTGTCH